MSTSNARDDLAREFPVTIDVMVSWGEMDAMGHVNNIVYFRYFESARIAYFERIGFLDAMRETGVGPILASTHCRFRIPLTYPDRVVVGASASELKDDRFVMRYRVVSESKNAVAAAGDGLIVSYDYRNERKAPLPPEVRRRIETLESRIDSV